MTNIVYKLLYTKTPQAYDTTEWKKPVGFPRSILCDQCDDSLIYPTYPMRHCNYCNNSRILVIPWTELLERLELSPGAAGTGH